MFGRMTTTPIVRLDAGKDPRENPRLLRDREWFVTPGRSREPVGPAAAG